MARRRGLTFRTYLRRRWRVTGLLIVLMAGTLLFQAVANKGHEPLWLRRDGEVLGLAVSPDGETVYAAVGTEGRAEVVRAVGPDGSLRWFHTVNASNVLLAAGDDWVAVATPFPGAELSVWRESDGSLLYREFIKGNPRALAAGGNHLALALQAQGNPVVFFDNLTFRSEFQLPSFVISLHVTPEGRVASGTTGGQLVVRDAGEEILNTSRPLHIQTVRMSADGSKLIIGGFSLVTGDLSGAAEFFDLDDPVPTIPQWSHPTAVGVGYVDLSLDGTRAVAVEERAPNYLVHYFETADPRPQWTYRVPGIVARDAEGDVAGVALAPDGEALVVSPIERGGIVLLRTSPRAEAVWQYASEGSTLLTFAPANPDRFAANARILPLRPYDGTLLFDVDAEPFRDRFPVFALLLVGAEAVAGVAFLAGGFVWEKRRK